MTFQNRVDPWGSLLETSARGAWMGNRGCLHNGQKEIVRSYQTKRWIICKLEFKGRHRTVLSPGLYTELFFLDEATAFSAGHRPCAECQRSRYAEFKQIWLKANGGQNATISSIDEIDAELHRERFENGKKVTFKAKLTALPHGTFFGWEGSAYLVHSGGIGLWSFSGYSQTDRLNFPEQVDVLTPKSIVKIYERGFLPEIHRRYTPVE
jgi:hypothetical protein